MVPKVTLPLFTRASDIPAIQDCSLRYVLEKAFTDSIPANGYFHTGTGMHAAFEAAATQDLSLPDTIKVAINTSAQLLYEAEEEGRDINWTKRRSGEKWREDVERIVKKWWMDVHPSSDERIKRYNEFQWPPVVEHVVDVEFTELYGADDKTFRLHTTIDAIFVHNSGEFSAVVDWKTGATKKAKPMQLNVYRYGLETEGWAPPVKEQWFHHVDHSNPFQEVEYAGPAFANRWIVETQRRKERQVYLPNQEWWCNYCRVKDKCPIFAGEDGIHDVEVTFLEDPDVYYKQHGSA